jgi:hypothetical protein
MTYPTVNTAAIIKEYWQKKQLHAQTVIARAYRKYALRNPYFTLKHVGEPDPIIQEFLNGHDIAVSRLLNPAVQAFHQNLLNKQWVTAFADKEFIKHAMILLVHKKIAREDFYNCMDIWHLIEDCGRDKVNITSFAEASHFFNLPLLKSVLQTHNLLEFMQINFQRENYDAFITLWNESELLTKFIYVENNPADLRAGDYLSLYSHRQMLLNSYFLSAKGVSYDQQSYRIGKLSINDIEKYVTGELFTRPATVHYPGTEQLKEVHEAEHSRAWTVHHDFSHWFAGAEIPKAKRDFVFQLIEHLRKVLQQKWSSYIWYLLDGLFFHGPEGLLSAIMPSALLGDGYYIDEFLLIVLHFFKNKELWAKTFQINADDIYLQLTNADEAVGIYINEKSINAQIPLLEQLYHAKKTLLRCNKIHRAFSPILVCYDTSITNLAAIGAEKLSFNPGQLAMLKLSTKIHQLQFSQGWDDFFNNQNFLCINLVIGDAASPTIKYMFIDPLRTELTPA